MESTRDRLVLAAILIDSHTHANPALRKTLSAADMIVAGDICRLAALLCRIDVAATARILFYFGGNEAARTAELIGAVAGGQNIVLVTGMDTPSVGGPGYRPVAICVERDPPVTTVPGPSAMLTALTVSSLSCDRFCSEGLLPRKIRKRRARLTESTIEERIMIFPEASHRLHEWLLDVADMFNADRRAVVYWGLAKPHEEVARGGLAELAGWAADGVRDEVIIVVAGTEPARIGAGDAPELVTSRVADGEELSQVVRIVTGLLEAPRRKLCEATLTTGKKEQ